MATSDAIDWMRVREALPSTAHDLLTDVEEACRQHPEEPARAIDRKLQERLTILRQRFERLKERD